MVVYAIYSYEVQEGNRSLFYKETGKKAIDMANEIIGNLLKDGLTIIGKKRKDRTDGRTATAGRICPDVRPSQRRRALWRGLERGGH